MLVVTWLSLPYQLKCILLILKFIPEQLKARIYRTIKFAKILTAHEKRMVQITKSKHLINYRSKMYQKQCVMPNWAFFPLLAYPLLYYPVPTGLLQSHTIGHWPGSRGSGPVATPPGSPVRVAEATPGSCVRELDRGNVSPRNSRTFTSRSSH